MLDPSVSLSRKSNLNPLTGHESRTSEREHMGMFWQSPGLVADEKKEAHMEGSLYTAQFSFPQCQDNLSKANLSKAKPYDLRVVTQFYSHSNTPENCLWSSNCLVSWGSRWDSDRCHKQEPDLQEASTVDGMTNDVKKKEVLKSQEVILSEFEIQKMVWDNEECDGGAEPCSGIWSRAQHVQKHVENVYRLNRPWSLSSGRFAGIAGHVITSAYDGCAVKMRMIKCMVWVYNVPICAHACIWSYAFLHHNVILCAQVKLMYLRSTEWVCVFHFISSDYPHPL